MTEEQLKELIDEMEQRVKYFESYVSVTNPEYWEGKLTEAQFVLERLESILED
jgi:hypothetical protein